MLSILLKLGFGLLLFEAIVINGNKADDELIELINSKKVIDRSFRRVKEGIINKGKYGVVFKGTHINRKFEVAMKFVKKEFNEKAKKELEIYTCLKATCNKTDVEMFGIANVYHYTEDWNGYTLTVFSYFDGENLLNKVKKNYFDHSKIYLNINTLIVLRDFVRLSKYLYSCGIVHNKFKPEHIVLRERRTFFIDFDESSKMYKFNDDNISELVSEPICDWEHFLYCLCCISLVELNSIPKTDEAFEAFVQQMKNTNITKKIEENFEGTLRRVLIKFSKEIFERKNPIPNYDGFDDEITKEIYEYYKHENELDQENIQEDNQKNIEKRTLSREMLKKAQKLSENPSFTWLREQSEATTSSNKQQFDIQREIKVPAKFDASSYPKVNYELFLRKNQRSFCGMSQIFKINK